MPQRKRRPAKPSHLLSPRLANCPKSRRELLERISSPTRTAPLVVISRTETGEIFTDPSVPAAAGAEVWVADKTACFALTDALGRRLTVFAGAARIYPTGDSWREDPYAAPRFLAMTEAQAKRQQSTLMSALRRFLPAAEPDPTDAEPTAYSWVETTTQATALGEHLISPDRTHPVAVVTVDRGAATPYVDATALAAELQGVAPVYVIPTGAATWALSDVLPPYGDVYAGAARVYPPGIEWTHDPFQVPLRFATSAEEGAAAFPLLVADALRHLAPGEHHADSPAETEIRASGIVLGVVAGRALISLDDGQTAYAWPELVTADVAPEQVFTRGQRVTGRLDVETRRLYPRIREASEALAEVSCGDVILVRVTSVQAELCVVEPYPGVRIDLPIDRVLPPGESGDLRTMVSLREVIPVEILETSKQWSISALVADHAQPQPAPSLLPAGPPWLALQQDEPDQPTPTTPKPSPPPPQPTAHTPTELDSLLSENRRLTRQLQAMGAEISRLKNAAEAQTARIRKLERAKRQRSDSAAREILDADGARFDDPEEQLRFEVYLAWVRRFSDQERKTNRAMMTWTVGEHFFSSWAEVQGVERRKVVDVIVEVLTDLAPNLPGRELHQLRTGTGGDDPPRVRGRDTAWRVSLQVGTPQARRLHYWRGEDRIELASIRSHDDFRD